MQVLFLLIVAGLILFFLYYKGLFQNYTALTMDALYEQYDHTPVDYAYGGEYMGKIAEPGAESQPLDKGVDLFQFSLKEDQPVGQYDTVGFAEGTEYQDINSSKFRYNLTANGDMIARRSIDAARYSPVKGGSMVMTHADVPYDSTPATIY